MEAGCLRLQPSCAVGLDQQCPCGQGRPEAAPAFLTRIWGGDPSRALRAPLVEEAPECGEEDVGASGLLWLFTGSRPACVSGVPQTLWGSESQPIPGPSGVGAEAGGHLNWMLAVLGLELPETH